MNPIHIIPYGYYNYYVHLWFYQVVYFRNRHYDRKLEV